MPNRPHERNVVRVEADLVGLARAYLEKRARELPVIEKALARGDYSALHRIGHNLHGSGQMFGFEELTAIGVELQQAAEARNAKRIRRLASSIEEFLERTEVERGERNGWETVDGSGERPTEASPLGDAILIVDDDEMNRILIAHHLEKEGYAVVQCASGEEALAMLDRRPLPALVLLDVLMGATSGLEVCRHIKQSSSTSVIPVILLTALESKEDRMRGMQAGADDLLTKPVTRSALLEQVSRLLRARTSARD